MVSNSNQNTHPETGRDLSKANNEVYFRNLNERVEFNLAQLGDLARSEGQTDLIPNGNDVLHFLCECSKENCHERVSLSVDEYRRVHKDNRRFSIAKGHADGSIERVIERNAMFDVVEKYIDPPEDAHQLESTE